MTNVIYECQCAACLADKKCEEWVIHHQMNVLLSRLNEQQRRWYVALESKKIGHGGDQQRRWYVALESKKIGHGGDQQLSGITGMDIKTIRRGRRELDDDLASRSVEHTRDAGGGQPAIEKKTHRLRWH